MQSKRELIAALLIGVVLISFFVCMFADIILRAAVSRLFFWGIPIGALFGIATWLYLSTAWDPVNMRPTNSQSAKGDLRLLWIVVPAGVILSTFLPRLVGEEFTSLIVSCTVTWVVLTLGYVIVQLGWHHLK
jgi:hypothetical protein